MGEATQQSLTRIAAPAPIQTGEHDVLHAAVDGKETDRCVGTRDQQIDAGVVDPSHPEASARAPGDTVVERARAEHRRSRGGEDRGRDEPPSIERAEEYRTDSAGDDESGLMQPPAQATATAARQLQTPVSACPESATTCWRSQASASSSWIPRQAAISAVSSLRA